MLIYGEISPQPPYMSYSVDLINLIMVSNININRYKSKNCKIDTIMLTFHAFFFVVRWILNEIV